MQDVSSSRLTILAIDGQEEVLSQIASVASGAGFHCHCVHDARGAHEAMRHEAPDLIISDVNLDGRSGATVCEKLKHDSGLNAVPVMYLSSGQGPDIIRRAHADGGSYYLRKPFDSRVLLQLIEKSRPASQYSNS